MRQAASSARSSEGTDEALLAAVAATRRRFTKHVWTDLGGVRRARCVADGAAPCKVAKVCLAMPFTDDCVVEACAVPSSGELIVSPADEATFCGMQGMNVAMCDLLEEDGTPSELCPRSVLRRACDLAASEIGATVTLGFEIEFLLLGKGSQPVDQDLYASSRALDEQMGVLLAIVTELELAAGVRVLHFHCESASGQYEIALAHHSAREAVDRLSMAKEVISDVSARHGLVASFRPKAAETQAGNGQHCHIGLAACDGSNLFATQPVGAPGYGLTETGRAFMAGVVDHLPAAMAFLMSTEESFLRIRVNSWAGAYKVWGLENRECPVRLTSGLGGPSTNFEVKTFDATGNAYLGAAALIFAGLDGCRRNLALPACCEANPHALADGDPRKEALPSSNSDVCAALEADSILRSSIGTALSQAVAALHASISTTAAPPRGDMSKRH